MYGDQFGEFLCGYRGLKSLVISFPVLHATVYLGALPSMLITYC